MSDQPRKHLTRSTLWLAILVALACGTGVRAQEKPEVLDDRFQFELFASEPDIVTPTGATVDRLGRLLVIESHTHQRPDDYEGPETDRIRIVEDTDGDGKADRFRTFFSGTEATMSIRAAQDGWVYVATRSRIFRIRDANNDDVADQQERLVYLETTGDYPHNGLSGLVLDQQGNLIFGMGENLGVPYRMIGSDGTAQRGSGEGGIFRCDIHGRKLTRLATGFWNPFGICIDSHGRMFAVGNDADARPPSRLVQILETGDYGFQYRYGRSGIHPLQAWDGELPGTMPMVSGTGEAPCELVEFDGGLLTGSWGDFRIEHYELIPLGASFQARRKILVQGDEQFRPVALARDGEDSLYVTDWVDKSYPVHGKGRIWKLSLKDGPPGSLPELSADEIRARAIQQSVDWEAMDSSDRYIRQSAVLGFVRSGKLPEITWSSLKSPGQKLAFLQALRWKGDHSRADPDAVPLDVLKQAILDEDGGVRLYAIRWIADANVVELKGLVAQQLDQLPNTTPKLFLASVAALEYLETGKTSFDPRQVAKYFADVIRDDNSGDSIKVLALRMLPPDQVGELVSWQEMELLTTHKNKMIQREAVRTLALAMAFRNNQGTPESEYSSRFFDDEANSDMPQGQRLDALSVLGAPARDRSATKSHLPASREEWQDAVGAGGDAANGWRVFFGNVGRINCAACHQFQGRGRSTGPDLTGIVKRTSRMEVLDSILEPSRDMAPHYVPTILQTIDGQQFTGIRTGYDPEGKKETFQDAQGVLFQIDPAEVVARRQADISIMPKDLYREYTVDEIRDLLALLEED